LSWRWYNDIPVLKGIYQFKTIYRDVPFSDCFNLELYFSPDYPNEIPMVREVDNKIPHTFHQFAGGFFCLCTPSEQWLVFSKRPTLENFILNLVNPYLLSWMWYDQFNEMPWGERQHGPKGIIESYQDLLKVESPRHTIHFLGKLIMGGIGKNDDCPCGSGLTFRKCHKSKVDRLSNRLPNEHLLHDLMIILKG